MKKLLHVFALGITLVSYSQDTASNYRSVRLASTDTIVIDSIPINPAYFRVLLKNGKALDSTDYRMDFNRSRLVLNDSIRANTDSLVIDYLRYPDYLTRDYYVFDAKSILKNNGDIDKLYALQEGGDRRQFTPFDGLNTVGSISRGITVGNNQNAVVNSNLATANAFSGNASGNVYRQPSP